MIALIHVLGSYIPHHNRTILQFFNNSLAQYSVHARKFMVVDKYTEQAVAYPLLTISFYPNKSALAKAVITKAQINHLQRFFFHGQFNVKLWLALLNGNIRSSQFNWHIWGADLYEDSYNWKFRLFYPLRRMAYKRVGCAFATRGDLNYFAKRHPNVRGEVLYFPTRMDSPSNKIHNNKCSKGNLTILVGNSGDPSNKHIAAIKNIYHQFGSMVNIIVPMGYPCSNEAYINKIRKIGYALFSTNRLKILYNKLEFNEYITIISKCDLGYFNSVRQQGIGTLCLLIHAGIPCVLNRANPFCKDMIEQNIPLLFNSDSLNEKTVNNTKKQLALVNKYEIDFLSPNYIISWHHALRIASGDDV